MIFSLRLTTFISWFRRNFGLTDVLNGAGNKKIKVFVFITSLGLIGIIGAIRFFIGPELALSIFYLLPVFLCSWFIGRSAGVAVSILSALSWLYLDLLSKDYFSHFLIPFVNETCRLSVFLIITFIISALKITLAQEKTLASFDYLTGVTNRRVFYELAGIEIDRFRRYSHPFAALFIDIDNFKKINDTFGHQLGDALLYTVANVIKDNLRSTDIVSRIGGDEFAVLLTETNVESAKMISPRLHTLLTETMKKNGWAVTFSIGAAAFSHPPANIDELMRKLDTLMYGAKRQGKNSIKFEAII